MATVLPVPIATAELIGSYVSRRCDIFTTASICVDFAPCRPAAKGCPALLLLTLSPLHEVRAVRVRLDDETAGWQQLRLDETTLCPTAAPATAAMAVAMARAAGPQPETDNEEKEQQKEEEEEEEEEEEGVLVLNLGSDIGEGSDDSEASNNGNDNKDDDDDDDGFLPSTEYHTELDEFSEGMKSGAGGGLPTGRRWLLLTLDTSAFATDAIGPRPIVTRCCIDVALAPESLARGSYPHVSIVDSPTREDAFVLLAGQRCYDYFICPRIAYATNPSTGTFVALDVHVTAVTALPDAGGAQWEAVGIGALPARPRDLLCAFVRAPVANDEAAAEYIETYAGMEWRVRHHAAYTHLIPLVKGPTESHLYSDAGMGLGLYFFHCDHALCEELLALCGIAGAAWGAAWSPMAHCGEYNSVPPIRQESWVVAGGALSALLGMRRGVLCVRGGAVVAAEVLRSAAWRTPRSHEDPQVGSHEDPQEDSHEEAQQWRQIDRLRAQAAVVSGALELRWRALRTPNFDAFPSSAALVRAWALCALSGTRGFADFVREERSLAASFARSPHKEGPWGFAARYGRESTAALAVLSSYYCAASLRAAAARPLPPWRLLTQKQKQCNSGNSGNSGGNSFSFSGSGSSGGSEGVHCALLGAGAFTTDCGLALRHVRAIMRRDRAAGPPAAGGWIPRAVLHYKERRAKDSVCREIALDVKFDREPRGSTAPLLRATGEGSGAGIDVPVAVVYFALRGLPREREKANEWEKEGGARCRAMYILPCCWRLRGAALTHRVDQHTSFAILTAPCATTKNVNNPKSNNNNNSSGMRREGSVDNLLDSNDEADWGDSDTECDGSDVGKTKKNMDDKNDKLDDNNNSTNNNNNNTNNCVNVARHQRGNGLSLRLPLLLLRHAAAPPLLSLHVRHTHLWAPPGLSPSTANALQRAVLRRVMSMALREAHKNARADTSDAYEDDTTNIFTELLNQLLEDILDTGSGTAEERTARLTLFAAVAADVSVISTVSTERGTSGCVWNCVRPDLRARARRNGAFAIGNGPKRCRSRPAHASDKERSEKAHIAISSNANGNGNGDWGARDSDGDDAVLIAMHGFVRDVVAGDAARTAQQQQQLSSGRKVLRLRREQPDTGTEVAPSPAKLAAMMARVIAAPMDSNSFNNTCSAEDDGSRGTGEKEREVAERAKSAALALALPLWPLLHRSDKEEEKTAARTLLAALRSSGGSADDFVIEAYETLIHGDSA